MVVVLMVVVLAVVVVKEKEVAPVMVMVVVLAGSSSEPSSCSLNPKFTHALPCGRSDRCTTVLSPFSTRPSALYLLSCDASVIYVFALLLSSSLSPSLLLSLHPFLDLRVALAIYAFAALVVASSG